MIKFLVEFLAIALEVYHDSLCVPFDQGLQQSLTSTTMKYIYRTIQGGVYIIKLNYQIGSNLYVILVETRDIEGIIKILLF